MGGKAINIQDMWKPALVAAVIVVALSGCAAGVEVSAARVAAPVEVSAATSEPSETSEPVAAPITMTPVDPATQSEAQKAGFVDESDWFLRSIKASWTGDLPSDEALLGASALACQALEGGASRDSVTVVEGDGEAATLNNRNTVGYAIMAICPQFA